MSEEHNHRKQPQRLPEHEKEYLMSMRQALIMQLGAIEDRLGMRRSIMPKHRRRNKRH